MINGGRGIPYSVDHKTRKMLADVMVNYGWIYAMWQTPVYGHKRM